MSHVETDEIPVPGIPLSTQNVLPPWGNFAPEGLYPKTDDPLSFYFLPHLLSLQTWLSGLVGKEECSVCFPIGKAAAPARP